MSNGPTIYLLHFDGSYKHARHYLGYTENLEQRLAQHRAGRGSPLVAAAIADGISFRVAATWPGDRSRKRKLDNYKNSRVRLCPICRHEVGAADAGAQPEAGTAQDDEFLVRALAELSGPVTLPALYAHLRRHGHQSVGSLHGRLELLAASGRIRKSLLLGGIAWATVR